MHDFAVMEVGDSDLSMEDAGNKMSVVLLASQIAIADAMASLDGGLSIRSSCDIVSKAGRSARLFLHVRS